MVHGTATIEEGGAPELLQELAHVHLGPEVRFPPMDDPPPGVRIRIAVERVGGVGPWADDRSPDVAVAPVAGELAVEIERRGAGQHVDRARPRPPCAHPSGVSAEAGPATRQPRPA